MKKKLFTTMILGGLTLTAPLAAFAADDIQGEEITKEHIKHTPQEKIEFIEAAMNLQLEHAQTLLDALDENDDVDIATLNQIVADYAELEEFLDTIDADNMTRAELRETFFELRNDARELSHEFKTLIKDAFTEEERQAFREEFKQDRQELREELDIPYHPRKFYKGGYHR